MQSKYKPWLQVQKSRRSEYCQPHLIEYKNLRITNSRIKNAGLGLYNADRPIRRYERIIDYTGDESSTPITGNYVLEVNKNKFINATVQPILQVI